MSQEFLTYFQLYNDSRFIIPASLYLVMAGLYVVLWYFKRPFVYTLREFEVYEHLMTVLIVTGFSLLVVSALYIPATPTDTVHTEPVQILLTAVPILSTLHLGYFVVLYLLVLRKKIPGDIR